MQPQASPSMKRRSLSASSILQPNRPPVSSPASGTHVQFANEPPRTYHHQQQPSYSSQSYQPPGYYSSPYNNSNGQPSAPPPPPPQSSAQTQGSPYMRSRRQESNPDTSSATLASRFAGASPNHSISTVMPSSGVRPHIQQYYPPSVSSGFGSRRPSAETSSITSTASGPAQLIHHSTSDPSMNPGPAITATGPPPNPGTSVPKKKGMFWIPQFRSKKENSLPEDVESPMATPIEQGSPLSSAAALRKAYPKDSSPSRDSPIARYQAQNAGKPLEFLDDDPAPNLSMLNTRPGPSTYHQLSSASTSWGGSQHGSSSTISGESDYMGESAGAIMDDRVGYIRVFRADGSFSTISCRARSTVADLLSLLAKKFVIHDKHKFHLALQHSGTERIMSSGERPIFLQHQLLEQVGYQFLPDRIDIMGREDNSYLFRFLLREVTTNEVDPSIWTTMHPSRIYLSGMGLSMIPSYLCLHVNELMDLDLSRNPSVTDFAVDFARNLHVLQRLTMRQSQMFRPPKTLYYINTLVELDLGRNRIKTLDGSGMERLVNLERLDLSHNLIRSIPEGIFANMSSLHTLILNNNRFTHFPQDPCRYLGKCLRYLDLSFCRITGKLPEYVGDLRSLEYLKLVKNKIKAGLPQSMGYLNELKEIDLRSNLLGEPDDAFGSIPMGGSGIAKHDMLVLEILRKCQQLTTVRLDGNRLFWCAGWDDRSPMTNNPTPEALSTLEDTTTPLDPTSPYFIHISRIKKLTMSFQRPFSNKQRRGSAATVQFSSSDKGSMNVPNMSSRGTSATGASDTASIAGSTSDAPTNSIPLGMILCISNTSATLTQLDVSDCGIKMLPNRFFERLTGLEVLKLNGNRLRELPPFAMLSLQSLVPTGLVTNNAEVSPYPSSSSYPPLASAPMIGALRLREVYLARNKIEAIPTSVGYLGELLLLDMQSNRISSVPPDIWNCGKLRVLNLTCNQIKEFRLPILNSGLGSGHGHGLGMGGLGGLGGVSTIEPDDQGMRGAMTLPSEGSEDGDGSLADTHSPMSPKYGTFARNRAQKISQHHLASSGGGSPLAAASSLESSEGVLSALASQPTGRVIPPPLSATLEALYIAENRLDDEFYQVLYNLQNLHTLNVSFNEITDITAWVVAKNASRSLTERPWFERLQELYLSGNQIAILPPEIERLRALRWLFLNGNKLSTIPGEVARMTKLAALDLGSQAGGRGEGTGLRYNVTNWPYEWNWNWNLDLKYLNLSGNQRLEITSAHGSGMVPTANVANVHSLSASSPSVATRSTSRVNPVAAAAAAAAVTGAGAAGAIPNPGQAGSTAVVPAGKRDLSDFSALTNLRMLGLTDVTYLIVLPDDTTDRRVRTMESEISLEGCSNNAIHCSVSDVLARPRAATVNLSVGPGSDTTFERRKQLTTGGRVEDDGFFGVWDLVLPKFRNRTNEALFGVFDGRGTAGGTRMAKYLFDTFKDVFANELEAQEKELEKHQGASPNVAVPPVPQAAKPPAPSAFGRRGSAATLNQPVPVVSGINANLKANRQSRLHSPVALDSNAIMHALRRTFLILNKDICTRYPSFAERLERKDSYSTQSRKNPDDSQLFVGCSATVIFLCTGKQRGTCTAYVANVGDGMAVISRNGGSAETLTKLCSVNIESLNGLSRDREMLNSEVRWMEDEIERIQNTGGFMSRVGLINERLDISRAFGYSPFLGAVNADPFIRKIELNLDDQSKPAKGAHSQNASRPNDEFIVITSAAVWKALRCGGTYEDGAQRVVSIAHRSIGNQRESPVGSSGSATPQARKITGGWNTAAMKVRDVALSLHGNGTAGMTGDGYMVMLLGLRDLAKKQWLGGSSKRTSVGEHMDDAPIVRVPKNELAPVGSLALVFTDIRNSTAIWESNSVAMRQAIKLHNSLMRRLIKEHKGYEVKTEGDAFMISFQNPLNALEWCLAAQRELMNVTWPEEILAMYDGCTIHYNDRDFIRMPHNSQEAKKLARTEKRRTMLIQYGFDTGSVKKESDVVWRGLCIRMGVHYGSPLCEIDPVTSRMDYFGPMVNRAARVSGASQGGQILLSSDMMKVVRSRFATWLGPDSDLDPVVDGDDMLMSARPPSADVGLTQLEMLGYENDEDSSATGPRQNEDNAIIRRLLKMGVHAWLIGEVRLKGLETPDMLYSVYPTALHARHKFLTALLSGQLHIYTPEEARQRRYQITADLDGPQPDLPIVPREEIQRIGDLCLKLEHLAGYFTGTQRPRRLLADSSAVGALRPGGSSEWQSADPLIGAAPTPWQPDPDDEMESNGGKLAVLEGLLKRIEAISMVLYISTLPPFRNMLQPLTQVLSSDSENVIEGLQALADYLRDRREKS